MILDARIVDRMPKQEIYGWRVVGYSEVSLANNVSGVFSK
jgi:hypothetical protein